MARLLAVALAGVVSVGMAVGVGAGVATSDSSTRGHSHSHNGVHGTGDSGADTESQELLPPHLVNLKDDPNRRKQLLDLLQHSVSH